MKLFLFAFLFFAGSLTGHSQSLEECRKWYDLGIEDESYAEKLSQSLTKWSQKSSIQTAYWAASQTLLAKHAWNPATKLSLIDEAEKAFDRCVLQNPESMEIRYLRFSYERNLPSFLQGGNHIKEDVKKMIALFRQNKYRDLPASLAKKTRDSLLLYGSCSENDRLFLKSLSL